jgi:predicted phage terminase large subunit-like protein
VTGKHADIQVCDDPHKPLDAQNKSGVNLEKVKNWWSGTMASRHRDPKFGRRLIIMQRLHEDDLSGVCLAQGYEHLCLPAHFDPDRASRTSVGGDRRTKRDELLFEQRFPESTLKKLSKELGDHAQAQYEQEPSFKGGGPIKAEHFRYWRRLPDQWDALFWSWDCTFKDTSESDFVCGQFWGKAGPNYFLLWRVYEKMDFSTTLDVVLEMRTWGLRQFGHGFDVIVEDKANGTAVINVLTKKVPGLVAVTPIGGKVARAQACSFLFRGGNVFFPHPELDGYEWSKDHASTVKKFPKVQKDDTVDAMTQALLYGEMREGNMIEALRAHMTIQKADHSGLYA